MSAQPSVRFWALVEYYKLDQLQYKALMTYDAKPIAVAKTSEEFVKTSRDDLYMFDSVIGFMSAYPEEKTQLFFSWSLEEKAAFSQTWKPIVDAYIKNHPYFHGKGSTAYEATRAFYGLPDAHHVKQEVALETAKEEVVSLGASSKTIDSRMIYTYFDVSDANHPKWKFTFTHAVNADASEDGGRYRVIINANTGQAEDSFKIQNTMDRIVAFY